MHCCIFKELFHIAFDAPLHFLRFDFSNEWLCCGCCNIENKGLLNLAWVSITRSCKFSYECAKFLTYSYQFSIAGASSWRRYNEEGAPKTFCWSLRLLSLTASKGSRVVRKLCPILCTYTVYPIFCATCTAQKNHLYEKRVTYEACVTSLIKVKHSRSHSYVFRKIMRQIDSCSFYMHAWN